MDELDANMNCLGALGVTMTQSSAANSQFDVFRGFPAVFPTDKVCCLCEHNDVVGFFCVHEKKIIPGGHHAISPENEN